jgi:quinol monooxygenase YgiN
MVILQGEFRIDPAERDAFLAQGLETIRISRGEKGNLEYVTAPDPLESDRIILSERWESMDDLNAHVAALTQRRQEAADRGEASGVALKSRSITIYEVTESRPMG